MRTEIRDASYSELTDFFESLMKFSEKVGEDACHHLAKTSQIFAEAASTGRSHQTDYSQRNPPPFISPSAVVSNKKSGGSGAAKDGGDIRLSEDGSLTKELLTTQTEQQQDSLPKSVVDPSKKGTVNALDKIDFGPLHRCCQIFGVLSEREQFEIFYRKQRRDQILVIVTHRRPKPSDESFAYIRHFNKVAGFFIVEDRIAQLQPTLVTASHKSKLWEVALDGIGSTMSAYIDNGPSVTEMLMMKKIILLFTVTTKSYGYNAVSLYNLLQTFRDHYNEILMTEYCAFFRTAIEEDNYTPITVNNEQEFAEIVRDFPLVNRRGADPEQQATFPRRLPFSKFVPNSYRQAKSYLLSCLRFMDNLQLSRSDMNDTVRRYANVLLERWSATLREFFDPKMQSRRSLVQLIQITVNIGYLEKSCEYLERYITEIVNEGYGRADNASSSIGGGIFGDDAGEGHLITLKNQVFRDSRSEVEQQISESLDMKVWCYFNYCINLLFTNLILGTFCVYVL